MPLSLSPGDMYGTPELRGKHMANNLDSGYWGPEDLKRFLDNGKRIVLFATLLLVVIAGSRSYFRWRAR